MDEAVEIALKGLRDEVGQVRHDVSVLRDDFSAHAQDDTKQLGQIREIIAGWKGQAMIVAWLAGAIFTALLAHVIRHWQ